MPRFGAWCDAIERNPDNEDRPLRQHETRPKQQHRDHHDPALVVWCHRSGTAKTEIPAQTKQLGAAVV